MDVDTPVDLTALPVELLAAIFDWAPAVAVLSCAGVCHGWRTVALADRAWQPRLAALRSGKHFCGVAPAPDPDHAFFRSTCAAFFATIRDSKRTWLTLDELVGLEFCFRFKSGAGESWTSMDPWWRRGEAIRLRLHADRTVRPVGDARPFWGVAGQVAGRFRVEPGHECDPLSSGSPRPTVVTMNGHPSYTVRRHPSHWGVYMESCWCVWTGFPMAPRGDDLAMEDEALSVTADDARQRREVDAYNLAVRVPRHGGGV